MTAIAILVVALCIATAAGTWIACKTRMDRHWNAVEDHQQINRNLIADMQRRLEAVGSSAPVLAPDPRVDELMRVVSTLKGAEALQQVFKR